jgi:hypothetical protein
MNSHTRNNDRWPPRAAAGVVMKLLPEATRYSDYRDFLAYYRQKVSPTTTRRAVNYAVWRACDDSWRCVPDYVKHGLMAIIVKLLPWGN